MYLKERRPNTKGEHILLWNRSGGGVAEDGDGDTESPPNDGNSVPQYPPWITNQERHGDCVPLRQGSPSADGYKERITICNLYRYT